MDKGRLSDMGEDADHSVLLHFSRSVEVSRNLDLLSLYVSRKFILLAFLKEKRGWGGGGLTPLNELMYND